MDGLQSIGWTWAMVQDMSPELFEGVEFYRRSIDAPLEFRSSILALWRRSPNHRVPK